MIGRRVALFVLLAVGSGRSVLAQDTSMVQGGIYQRPYLINAGRAEIGGYAEGNASWFRTDGLSDGLSMELRRFNLFAHAALGTRLRFTSELEFEHGTEEISLETALVDFMINPSLVVRAGIVLVPIGGFNVNHDSPRYEFVDRPLVSTVVIPATFSDVGFGIHGRFGRGRTVVSYDALLSNGLGDGIVLNALGRTSFAAGKTADRFEEDANGSPAMSGRIAVHHRGWGEIGLSYYEGAYNRFRIEGVTVAPKRKASIAAVDFTAQLIGISLQGEAALGRIDLPPDLSELFAKRQWGGFLDAVLPVWHPRIKGLARPVVNLAVRLERVDLNSGTFVSTGRTIFDDQSAVSVGVGFRPAAGTVFRVNYRHLWARDAPGNPTSRTGGFELGFATYF